MKRNRWSLEDKLQIVLAGLRGEESIAELCRRHGISETLFYKWRQAFLEAGKEGLMDKRVRHTSREGMLERENEELKKVVGELSLRLRLLKKLH